MIFFYAVLSCLLLTSVFSEVRAAGGRRKETAAWRSQSGRRHGKNVCLRQSFRSGRHKWAAKPFWHQQSTATEAESIHIGEKRQSQWSQKAAVEQYQGEQQWLCHRQQQWRKQEAAAASKTKDPRHCEWGSYGISYCQVLGNPAFLDILRRTPKPYRLSL